jgi:hypothetical protein
MQVPTFLLQTQTSNFTRFVISYQEKESYYEKKSLTSQMSHTMPIVVLYYLANLMKKEL